LANLPAVFADNFLGKDFQFQPRLGPFIALAVIGFVIGVVGHITQTKTMVVVGIAMVFAAVLFVPLALYLSGRG
jgi:sulfite exporter TauE/SafE